jgi:dienelactone hydrolase
MKPGAISIAAGLLTTMFLACGSDGSSPVTDPGTGTGTGDGGGTQQDGGGNLGTDGGATRDTGGGDTSPPPGDGATGDTGNGGVPDPNADGPFAYAEKDATTTITATGDSVAVHAAYPTAAGAYPVIVFAHGFQLSPSLYKSYLQRLATFGYVALSVDFPTSFLGNDNPAEAKDLVGGIDWAKADATIGPVVDVTTAGMTGHSLGGKLALLAATTDPRVKASIVLDPVDGGGPTGCTAPKCVTVADLMPSLKIPTGFLGETTDATGSFQACAPAASNYTTFYAKTSTPSLEVTVTGANHMSFVDDVTACGTTCSVCNAATAPNAQVNAMAKAYVVAFYERWLRGKTAYDAYLTGAQAQARYVATSQATIVSK